MSRFAGEKLNAADFKDIFGLEGVAEDQAYSGGSTTGTKQVGALGTYMTENDYNRLKNDDTVWDAYAGVYGKDAAAAKREGSDGLSINALDGLFDKLSVGAAAPTPETSVEEPTVNPETQAAIDRATAYEADLPNFGTDIFGERNTEVYGYDYDWQNGIRPEGTPGAVTGNEAQEFADKYKLGVTGQPQGTSTMPAGGSPVKVGTGIQVFR